MKTIDYTQFDFHDDIKKLVSDIEASGKRYDVIVGLSRGGLIPGVVLSHKLGVPFMALNWSKTYTQPDVNVQKAMVRGSKVLVVDDMVDTGELLRELFGNTEVAAKWVLDAPFDVSNIDLAVLINNVDVKQVYENETGTITANFWGREISRIVTPDWITYWWEK